MQQRKHVIVLTALLLIGAVIVLLVERSSPVQIGYLGSLSGRFAALGTSARNGALLAIEERNDAGGIDGHPVELLIINDEGQPDQTRAALDTFQAAGISAIIGPFTTASATAIIDDLDKRPMLLISPTAAGDNLAKRDDRFIKFYPSTALFGQALAEDMQAQGQDAVTVIWDAANSAFAETMMAVITAPVTLTSVPFDSRVATDHQAISHAVLASRPDAVLLICSAIDTARFCQRLRQEAADLPLYSSSWGIANELIENGGRAIEGLQFFITYMPTDARKQWQDFVFRYRQRFLEDPTHVALMNYEATSLLLDTIEETGSTAPEVLRAAICSATIRHGIQGDYRIDTNGDADWPIYRHTIRNAQIIADEPP